jgi:hypothetical protein
MDGLNGLTLLHNGCRFLTSPPKLSATRTGVFGTDSAGWSPLLPRQLPLDSGQLHTSYQVFDLQRLFDGRRDRRGHRRRAPATIIKSLFCFIYLMVFLHRGTAHVAGCHGMSFFKVSTATPSGLSIMTEEFKRLGATKHWRMRRCSL